MAFLISEKTISIQDSRSKDIELFHNNNNNNEEMCEIKAAQKEKKEEEMGEVGFEPTDSNCDELYHKQYSRSTNNVQSYSCDIKQYDKDNHKETKCDRPDDVFLQDSNNRKCEKNEYCEQFSESPSGNNPTQSSSNQTNSRKDKVNSKTECTNLSLSNYSSSNSTLSKTLYSSTSNSLSPKVHRATSAGNSEKSSRSNSERSFKHETSPKRNSRESSASCGSRNSLTCDRKMKDISVNDLSEELVEKWIMNNASGSFVDKLIQLKQNERTRREIREDREAMEKHHRFSSLETMSTNESSSNVSNSIESVSSYNDPMSSCMDLTIRNSASTCNKRTSVTSDLFNLWISNSPIKRCKSPNR